MREIPPADAALLALAAAGGIRSVLSRQDHKTLRTRIDACTGRLDALAPGLGKAVRALPMTMIAAQGGMGAADRDDVTELMSMHRALTTLGCALTAVFATAWPTTATDDGLARSNTHSARPPPRPYARTTARCGAPLTMATAPSRTSPAPHHTPDRQPALGTAPPSTPWPGTRNATRPASPSPQPPGEVPGGSTSEDCLHLNVTTPDTAAPARQARPQPVIVWPHGGGFTTGAGSSCAGASGTGNTPSYSAGSAKTQVRAF
ncbi:hypothetical protein SANT12839_097990 [Streptomyces antimycoticus]|uniref:Carboxylesterase type B domain-containing protein n=1 Tax=Streptomyces antimycoticus TaxID=68175 RepID=A0A4D4KR68_9ACTN|nr:hypothetical protein SANT12839_097990 [Streptomyces antimycoticus]